MAIVASRPSAGTSASLLATNADVAGAQDDYPTKTVLLKNVTGSASVFLGGNDAVTTTTGFEWAVADGPITVDLEPGESLYGIVAATPQTVHVLRGGR